MHALSLIAGLVLFAGILLDAFQTIILPRRPVGRIRITRAFFRVTWTPWVLLSRLVQQKRREQFFSIYGPLSLLLLFILWAALLTTAYALLYFGLGTPFRDPLHLAGPLRTLRTCFYVSGSTLFTLGLGDVVPTSHAARFLAVCEAGTGLGFVALVIGYVPVLYTAFSAREVEVALLDARAGSPPTAAELLTRHGFDGGHEALDDLLAGWERWCATMLETHISYPLLCWYRSQHDNQSWLAALTAVLDTCALLITTLDGPSTRQAQLTFAVGRHVLVDLGHVFHLEAAEARLLAAPPQRLDTAEYARLCEALREPGFALCGDHASRQRLDEIRRLYEPAAIALGQFLHFDLPLWVALPPDPSRRPSPWASIMKLRTPTRDRLTTHVSRQSTANHLEDGE